MRQMVYSVSMTKKKYFHEVIEEDQKILDIGLKQSRLNKKERKERFPTAEERWPRKGIIIKKTVSEQLQDELEPIDND